MFSVRTPIVAAFLMSFGLILVFSGLAVPKRSTRFRRDLYRERRIWLLNLLSPLRYTRIGRYLSNQQKSLNLAELELLLYSAGQPFGLKARHIQLMRLLLPILLTAAFMVFYGLGAIFKAGRNSLFPFLIILLLAVIANYLPVTLLKYLERSRDSKVKEEQGTFTETVFTLLRVRQPLRIALEEAAKTTEFLEPYLQICLNEWPTDRVKALQNLKKNVGVMRFEVIVDMLIQAITLGDEKTSDFLEENKRLEDELINLSISTQSKIRPVLMTFHMIIPLAIILLVLFYPAMQQVHGLLYAIPW